MQRWKFTFCCNLYEASICYSVKYWKCQNAFCYLCVMIKRLLQLSSSFWRLKFILTAEQGGKRLSNRKNKTFCMRPYWKWQQKNRFESNNDHLIRFSLCCVANQIKKGPHISSILTIYSDMINDKTKVMNLISSLMALYQMRWRAVRTADTIRWFINKWNRYICKMLLI